jgi:hypothetical protein
LYMANTDTVIAMISPKISLKNAIILRSARVLPV